MKSFTELKIGDRVKCVAKHAKNYILVGEVVKKQKRIVDGGVVAVTVSFDTPAGPNYVRFTNPKSLDRTPEVSPNNHNSRAKCSNPIVRALDSMENDPLFQQPTSEEQEDPVKVLREYHEKVSQLLEKLSQPGDEGIQKQNEKWMPSVPTDDVYWIPSLNYIDQLTTIHINQDQGLSDYTPNLLENGMGYLSRDEAIRDMLELVKRGRIRTWLAEQTDFQDQPKTTEIYYTTSGLYGLVGWSSTFGCIVMCKKHATRLCDLLNSGQFELLPPNLQKIEDELNGKSKS